jgi:hypothetical protein
MNRSARAIGLVCALAALARSAAAQKLPQIRFTMVDASGHHEWSGGVAWVSRDSLHLFVDSSGRIAAFSRSSVSGVERRRWKVSPAKAAGIGCLVTGGALGALGYFGTHDPDSPGLEKTIGVIGAVVGCGAGAIGGLVTSAVRGHRWEPWALPDSASYLADPPRGR